MSKLGLVDRFKNAWNTFRNKDPAIDSATGNGYFYRPDRPRLTRGGERTIVTAIFNRIAIDVSQIEIRHCMADEDGRFSKYVVSGLNDRLSLDANIDQTGRAFLKDTVLSMFDNGCVALVPVDTDTDPNITESYDILSIRAGQVVEWKPRTVKVRLYNDRIGEKEDVVVQKRLAAIVENPWFPVINEPNSIARRLIRKLAIMDVIDEHTGSDRLDLIFQLPYQTRTDLQRKRAETRRKDIEDQLTNSKYGIAYIDATEHVTQLNRPVENNLMKQIEFLTSMLYSQLGITQEIMDGSADEKTMLNYYSRTIEPIVYAIVDEMNRKFISKTARTKGHRIMAFRSPFKFTTAGTIADIADKFTRNEIMSSNEIRQEIGLKPSKDPKADQLINSNLNHSPEELNQKTPAKSSEAKTEQEE